LNKFKIAETDTFSSKISDTKFSKIYKKIMDYVYPQLRDNPFFGTNIKKLKGELEVFCNEVFVQNSCHCFSLSSFWCNGN